MTVRLTLLDSGGSGKRDDPGINVTARAYEWWRRLNAAGLGHRVALTKGTAASPDSRGQAVSETYPDTAARADRHSTATGDVPLYLLHVNALKDALDADLAGRQ
jgi:phage terminase large subunit GpA-like protein